MIVFTLLSLSTYALAQVDQINFRQISPPGGFALKGINSIKQDCLGYMWVATRQGLIRYDSENIKWFTPIMGDSLSLPNEFVNDIYADDKEYNVWVSTNDGLCQFNREKQCFSNISYTYEDNTLAEDSIVETIMISDNKLLLLDAVYIGILDLGLKKMTRFGKDLIKAPSSIYLDDENRVWIGTKYGKVFRYDILNDSLELLVDNRGKVNCLFFDNNYLYVGMNGEGVNIYNYQGNFINQLSLTTHSKGTIRVIKKDTYGRLWIGAYEGLFVNDGTKILHLKPDEYTGLPHNSIYEIFEDKQGGIWIGTWSGGVALSHHSDNNFKTFRHQTHRNSISNNTISSFVQLNNDNLLIGSEVGGLNKYNLKSEHFSVIKISQSEELANIKSLCKDKYNTIWVGTFKKGIWYKKSGSTKFKMIGEGTVEERYLSTLSSYSLCPSDSGVWIGGLDEGLLFYNFENKTVKPYLLHNTSEKLLAGIPIQSMLIDSESNLWIGTLYNFLYKVNLRNGNLTQFSANNLLAQYKSTSVYYLYEHSSGDIWIGTKNNGVLIYHPDNKQFDNNNETTNIEYKDVYGIIEDEQQRIWLSTNNGIFVLGDQQNVMRHFLYADGIQSNLFCPQSIFKDKNGVLYFGGTNGFTKIVPSELKFNAKKPRCIINSITISDSSFIYPKYQGLNEMASVILNPGDNNFKISFSADNYFLSENNQYKYRLLNHNKQWVNAKGNGYAIFNKIKAGKYIFEVKACNNDKVWNEVPVRLPIEIKNYWYRTTYAILLYLFVVIGFFYLIVRFYTERLNLKRALLYEKKQSENKQQIQEMKLKFFTNVSHEFRTPLTLMTWPLTNLVSASNLTAGQKEEIGVVKSNANRLLQLINQILDLRKLEKGKEQLVISNFDLVPFITEIQKSFCFEGKERGVSYNFNSSFSTLQIDGDQEKLNTVIYNLFSNAYKFTDHKGQISVTIAKSIAEQGAYHKESLSFGKISTEDFVKISVEDNGKGIDRDSLIRIFNRFDQGNNSQRNNIGSGIGLSICKDFVLLHHGKITVSSTLGLGTRFEIILPLKQYAQKILFDNHEDKTVLVNSRQFLSSKDELKDKPRSSTILIVEDNKDLNKLLCKFLEAYYKIETAESGSDALLVLSKRNVDMVVSDVMMPSMDGMELCATIKSQLETSHIPVVLLTALSSSESQMAGLDNGADAYITKPFDKQLLLKRIESILKERKRLRNNFRTLYTSGKSLQVGSLDSFFLNQVKSAIEEKMMEENFGIDVLIKELMISRSQLHRKIKTLSGMTTSEYINMVKMQKAVEYIKSSEYTFNEIAFKLGFSSQSYFTRCFKKVYKITPKEYFEKGMKI